jgi:hypothetical protein
MLTFWKRVQEHVVIQSDSHHDKLYEIDMGISRRKQFEHAALSKQTQPRNTKKRRQDRRRYHETGNLIMRTPGFPGSTSVSILCLFTNKKPQLICREAGEEKTHCSIAPIRASFSTGIRLSEWSPRPQITRRRVSPATSASRIPISVLRIASLDLSRCTSIVRSSG